MDTVNKYLQWTAVVSITAMLFIIFIQVICRYVFQHSLVFSEELARYLFVYTVFLGSAVLMRENGHIVVEVLIQKLKGKMAKYTKIVAYLSTLLFVIILFYQGYRMTVLTFAQRSPALGIPMSFVYLVIPTASFVMICNILILIRDTLSSDNRNYH